MSNTPWRVNNGRGSDKSGVANHGYGQVNNSGPAFNSFPNQNPSGNPYSNAQNQPSGPMSYPGSTPPGMRPQTSVPPTGFIPNPQMQNFQPPNTGESKAVFSPKKSSFEFEFLLLVLAIVLSVVAFVVALTNSDKLPLGIACWIVSSPVVMSLLTIYFNVQSSRRTKLDYTIPGWAGLMVWITLIAMGAAIVASAYAIADYVGRM